MKVISALSMLLLVQSSVAQPRISCFKPLRYTEDYSALKNDTTITGYKKVKYLRLSRTGDAYLSVGGDLRYQYFSIRNEDWGNSPKDEDGFVLSRFLAHADVHVSPHLRSFVQLQSSMASDKATGTSAVEENSLDLHQAFVDINNKFKTIVFRIGRQEFLYGSQRLIAVRELPNNRQAFDGAKLIVQPKTWQLDLFYSRYVLAKKGLFNDASRQDIQLWGTYAAMNHLLSVSHVDVYYLGLQRTAAVFEDGKGEEKRHSFGLRVWNEKKRWRYDLEAVYQLGSFLGKSIRAWTGSANIGYSLPSVFFAA